MVNYSTQSVNPNSIHIEFFKFFIKVRLIILNSD